MIVLTVYLIMWGLGWVPANGEIMLGAGAFDLIALGVLSDGLANFGDEIHNEETNEYYETKQGGGNKSK